MSTLFDGLIILCASISPRRFDIWVESLDNVAKCSTHLTGPCTLKCLRVPLMYIFYSSLQVWLGWVTNSGKLDSWIESYCRLPRNRVLEEGPKGPQRWPTNRPARLVSRDCRPTRPPTNPARRGRRSTCLLTNSPSSNTTEQPSEAGPSINLLAE